MNSAAALLLLYALGYVPGSLLVAPRDDRHSTPLAVIRLLVGLLLSTLAFLFSLLVRLPWYVGPTLVFVVAAAVHRRSAFAPPRPRWRVTRAGVVAVVLAGVLLSPMVIGALRMAPGPFAPVFFHVDTAYFMEKVHALVRSDTYPPPSLGVAGGVTPYHYGIQGLAAMIARGSGVAPHHAVFLVVVPLLAIGMAAAAVILARAVSPSIPIWATVPLLLTPVPTLWYSFWADIGVPLVQAASPPRLAAFERVTAGYEVWGVALNPGTNIGAAFIVIAALAGVATAPARGWRLPAFLIGSAVIFKVPAGIALCAGLFGFLAAAALLTRNVRLLVHGVPAAGIFAVVYGLFFSLPGTPGRSVVVEPAWFLHLRALGERGDLRGFWLDLLWLFLPAVVVVAAGAGRGLQTIRTRLPILAFALVPLLLVNVLRLVDMRPGQTFVDDNWLQVLVPVTCVIHAFVLWLAGDRWAGLGRGARLAFFVAIAVCVLPSVFVAARYARILVLSPSDGHEFVDNRPLAPALAAIPIEGTLIVTNDLRYPAEGFRRDGRQLQIPALFGHTAFAVNFAYEHYTFSSERRAAQQVLESKEWSKAIDQAADRYGWTHLLIRKDYPHPGAIPLQQIFDSADYAVYRFEMP